LVAGEQKMPVRVQVSYSKGYVWLIYGSWDNYENDVEENLASAKRALRLDVQVPLSVVYIAEGQMRGGDVYVHSW